MTLKDMNACYYILVCPYQSGGCDRERQKTCVILNPDMTCPNCGFKFNIVTKDGLTRGVCPKCGYCLK